MVNEDNDFGFDETKSTVLDYFLLFREVKWVVITTVAVSIIVILLTIGLFNLSITSNGLYQQKQLSFLLIGLIMIITIILWLPLSNGRLIIHIISKGRKLQRELLAIQNNLIRRSYMINFELVEPEIVIQDGNPRLEKIMNHLSLVFPEVDRINKKRIRKKISVERYTKKFKRKLHFLRNYDLAIKTSLGWYVIQFYENVVKFSDIEGISKKFSFEKTIGAEIQRVIVIGKEFDSSFEKNEIRKEMNSLKRKIPVDVILENEYGYSTIWID